MLFSKGKNLDHTRPFNLCKEKVSDIRGTILSTYVALKEKNYRPIEQLVGYILTEDPTYVTTYNNARNNIRQYSREEILEELIRSYVEV